MVRICLLHTKKTSKIVDISTVTEPSLSAVKELGTHLNTPHVLCPIQSSALLQRKLKLLEEELAECKERMEELTAAEKQWKAIK